MVCFFILLKPEINSVVYISIISHGPLESRGPFETRFEIYPIWGCSAFVGTEVSVQNVWIVFHNKVVHFQQCLSLWGRWNWWNVNSLCRGLPLAVRCAHVDVLSIHWQQWKYLCRDDIKAFCLSMLHLDVRICWENLQGIVLCSIGPGSNVSRFAVSGLVL